MQRRRAPTAQLPLPLAPPQSAILTPEAGSVFPAATTESIRVGWRAVHNQCWLALGAAASRSPDCARLDESALAFPPASATRTQVRGYAWSGGGQPVARVDVSADGGASWLVVDVVGQEQRVRRGHALRACARMPPGCCQARTAARLPPALVAEASVPPCCTRARLQPSGRMWAWTLWEADVPIPPERRDTREWGRRWQLAGCGCLQQALGCSPRQAGGSLDGASALVMA